ncbi:hypothetical protein PUNSTDRAFT_102011 [Punctularia strigosozonata HHB-11173 SS5]|uniref:uncharacterized protein n=1 Tax=Punctularia strigosozonata (strain HHB-11173) TaxID=741275 RepID=UPI000441752E|nr:uncharacterized protein PUNSTDRAFT_102011 [Punctularia strigosozonata HHB-11173 SS5]EIN10034.1 hypothetical protein PUNSTDRAFT_102011 [Punctularia strigosozonata HHB-11173 SS5]
MPRTSKAINPSNLSDSVLGCFAIVPPSETLDHLVRYLSTWSGSDKLFMVIQYAVKLLVPLLEIRARFQHRVGLRKAPQSAHAPGLNKLASIIGDARTLWRIWGLLPIFQWLISLERNPPPTRKLLTIERLQGWSMLAYYPLEHISYLASHSIIPTTIPALSSILPLWLLRSKSARRTMKLDVNRLSLWSCRFWALYVMLQFAHLREDRQLLLAKERTLGKAKGKAGMGAAERTEVRQRWDAYWNELVVNLGYLPLTIHWSLEGGLYQNETWSAVFGLIAAVASFRSGWKATALHQLPPAEEPLVEPLAAVNETVLPSMASPGSLLDVPGTPEDSST